MPLSFEWDESKARTNLAKHDVSFEEATTVFADPLSLTIPDPAIRRPWPASSSSAIRTGTDCWLSDCWLSCTRSGSIISVSSAPGAQAGVNEETMKRASEKKAEPDIQPEYDFSRGVRGQYARRYADGTNVVVLEPDVAKAFPSAEAVNRSLRAVAEIIRSQNKDAAAR